MLWVVINRIYERSVDALQLGSHYRFYGRTRDEAWGYYQAHLKADSFIRGCTQNNRYNQVECRAEIDIQRVQ